MTSKIKRDAAEALFPLLSAFHAVHGLVLSSVWLTRIDNTDIEIALQFDSQFLVIKAESDDDTADVTIQTLVAPGEKVNEHQPWANAIGERFGWGWVIVNQQGYLDGVLLSFSGVIPEILIVVVASGLQVKTFC